MDRYLVYRCGWQGFGHIVVSIFNCARAAKDTGRILALDMTSFNYFKNDKHRQFFENFVFIFPEEMKVETDVDRVRAICSDVDRFEAPAWQGGDPAVDRPERVVIITSDAITRLHSIGNKFDFWPCRVELRGPLAARVGPELLAAGGGTATIGIYFRSGNGEFLDFRFDPISLPDYSARYQELLSRYTDVARVAARSFPGKRIRYFVASDSAKFVHEMRTRLGDVISRGDGGITGQFRLTVEAGNDGIEAIADAVIDAWNMAACDALIYSPSLFPQFAILNSQTLGPDNTYQLELSTVQSIVNALSVDEALVYLGRAYWRTPPFWWRIKGGLLRFRAATLAKGGRQHRIPPLVERTAALEECFNSVAMREANALLDRRKPEEALARATAGMPYGNAYACLFVAILEAFLGNHAAALDSVQVGLAFLPGAPELYLAESRILAALGNVTAAAASITKGLELCEAEAPLRSQRALLESCLHPGGALVNIAVNKTASQSSRSPWSHSNDPQGAVNGIFAANFHFHTNRERGPWWSVDLARVEDVRRIVVYNRDDVAQEQADGLIVDGSLDGRAWTQLGRADARFTGLTGSEPLDLWFGRPAQLRYVRLRLESEAVLHLQQVEIYAERAERHVSPEQK